ncbi:MAG: adenosylmethionine--8-amino-7-oxononanoate transaminase [Pirellulaceae bacterium]|nr:adenosylmethionine--8-amino-7-oxononanoate transaminase [Pirellulaceae bacterium]
MDHSNEPTIEQLKQWDKKHVWHSFTQMAEYEPFVISKGHGATLYDLQGNAFLDGVSSLWCNLHGHNHPRLNAALKKQSERVSHVTSLGMANDTTIKLAHRLPKIAPKGLEHTFFSSDGSSAVEVALKIAFQYWQQKENPKPQKRKYLALTDAYHGDTLGSVSVGGVARFHEMFHPLLFEVLRLPTPDNYRLPEGVTREEACSFYTNQLEEVLEKHHHELAAFVIEPKMQCAAGMLKHPEGYFKEVRRLTQKYNVLLIADEVAVGNGRSGTYFASEQEGVHPDILCTGKGLTGGYLPLAITMTTTEIWNAFLGEYHESKTLFHGHTYSGNPLGAALALESLNLFEDENLLSHVREKAKLFTKLLSELNEYEEVGDIRQLGLIAGVEFVQDRQAKTPFPWDKKVGIQICNGALEKGVWLRPLGNVLVILPPLSITEQELQTIFQGVHYGISQTFGNKPKLQPT